MVFVDFLEALADSVSSLPVLEGVATVLLVVYVVLISRENVWGWPFGIVGSGVFVYLSFQVSYYMDAGLNIYYVAAGFYGWYVWGAKNRAGERRQIGRLQKGGAAIIVIGGLLLSGVFGFILEKYTDNSWPYVDSFTTVFAFVATYMAARKLIENWLIWIVVDLVGVVMYFRKGLYFFVVLFVIYTVVAFYGYFLWRKRLNNVRSG